MKPSKCSARGTACLDLDWPQVTCLPTTPGCDHQTGQHRSHDWDICAKHLHYASREWRSKTELSKCIHSCPACRRLHLLVPRVSVLAVFIAMGKERRAKRRCSACFDNRVLHSSPSAIVTTTVHCGWYIILDPRMRALMSRTPRPAHLCIWHGQEVNCGGCFKFVKTA